MAIVFAWIFSFLLGLFLHDIFAELQKDFFRPVSQYSTKKCPNLVSAEFCHSRRINWTNACSFHHFFSFGVEMCHKLTVLRTFYAKNARNSSNYLKMSEFSFRNVRYPIYQDTDFMQLLSYVNGFVSFLCQIC